MFSIRLDWHETLLLVRQSQHTQGHHKADGSAKLGLIFRYKSGKELFV